MKKFCLLPFSIITLTLYTCQKADTPIVITPTTMTNTIVQGKVINSYTLKTAPNAQLDITKYANNYFTQTSSTVSDKDGNYKFDFIASQDSQYQIYPNVRNIGFFSSDFVETTNTTANKLTRNISQNHDFIICPAAYLLFDYVNQNNSDSLSATLKSNGCLQGQGIAFSYPLAPTPAHDSLIYKYPYPNSFPGNQKIVIRWTTIKNGTTQQFQSDSLYVAIGDTLHYKLIY